MEIIDFSVIRNASIFHVIHLMILKILIVFFVIARFTPSAQNAEAISPLRHPVSKTAPDASSRIKGKTMIWC